MAATPADGRHFEAGPWLAASHSSESGVSDLCSNSPQSETEVGGLNASKSPPEIPASPPPSAINHHQSVAFASFSISDAN